MEEIAEKLEEAYSKFVARNRSGYEVTINSITREVEALVKKYPRDREVKDYLNMLNAFHERKEGCMDPKEEKQRILSLISDLKQMVHWRKVGMSSGMELPYKDYRRMRGETGRRGL
ncbi:MAG: hypothetical protein ACE5NL_00585 [Candidatus Hydrothermarchaeaceae archaeon]